MVADSLSLQPVNTRAGGLHSYPYQLYFLLGESGVLAPHLNQGNVGGALGSSRPTPDK